MLCKVIKFRRFTADSKAAATIIIVFLRIMKAITRDNLSSKTTSLQKLGIYRCAIDLFTLSRKLKNKLDLKANNSDDHKDLNAALLLNNFSLSLVQVPLIIAEVETTSNYIKKVQLYRDLDARVERLTLAWRSIQSNLENREPLLKKLRARTESFEKHFKEWSLSHISQN